MKTARVLWLSRQEMTYAQFADLERLLGHPVELISVTQPLYSIDQIRPEVGWSQLIAISDLPLDLMPDLFRAARGRIMLRPVTRRIDTRRSLTRPDGMLVPETLSFHGGWEHVRAFFVGADLLKPGDLVPCDDPEDVGAGGSDDPGSPEVFDDLDDFGDPDWSESA